MSFYGYNPKDYVMKDRTGIGAASQIAGQAIADVPKNIQSAKESQAKMSALEETKKTEVAKREQLEQAAAAVEKDKKLLTDTLAGYKITIKNKTKPLVDSGAMTQQEVDDLINGIKGPLNTDLVSKDTIKNFIARSGKEVEAALKTIKDKSLYQTSVQARGGSQIGGAQQPQPPAQPQQPPAEQGGVATTPEVQGGQIGAPAEAQQPQQPQAQQIQPEAEPQNAEEYIRRIQEKEGRILQKEERENILASAGYSSQADIESQKLEKQKLEMKEKEINVRDAITAWRFAKLEGDKKRIQISEDNLKRLYNPFIAQIEAQADVKMEKIDKEIKAIIERSIDPMTGKPVPPPEEEIVKLRAQKKLIEREAKDKVLEMEKEKNMAGAISGETRTFKGPSTTTTASQPAKQNDPLGDILFGGK